MVTMKAFGCVSLLWSLSFLSCAFGLTNHVEAAEVAHRQLLTSPGGNDDFLPDENAYKIDPSLTFANFRQRRAYIALQALKKAIYSDPLNVTGNWDGPNVCDYNCVVCKNAREDPNMISVTTLQLNQLDLAGFLPVEIGFLTDITVLYMNQNRFSGTIPRSISRLKYLYRLDLSLNRFGGPFPKAVLNLPALKLLDIRFNDFEGSLPPELFNMKLDVIFLNNNRFESSLPDTIGNCPAIMLALSKNNFSGCIPESIGRLQHIEQLFLQGNSFTGCFPEVLTKLEKLHVLDIGDNHFVGPLPKGIANFKNIVEFDVSHNEFSGVLPKHVCSLPKLERLGITGNYFERKDRSCGKVQVLQEDENCFSRTPNQRSKESCLPVLNRPPFDCSNGGCKGSNPQPLANPSLQTQPREDDPSQPSSVIEKLSPPSLPNPTTTPLTPPAK